MKIFALIVLSVVNFSIYATCASDVYGVLPGSGDEVRAIAEYACRGV